MAAEHVVVLFIPNTPNLAASRDLLLGPMIEFRMEYQYQKYTKLPHDPFQPL